MLSRNISLGSGIAQVAKTEDLKKICRNQPSTIRKALEQSAFHDTKKHERLSKYPVNPCRSFPPFFTHISPTNRAFFDKNTQKEKKKSIDYLFLRINLLNK
jgi:hypothetical protein